MDAPVRLHDDRSLAVSERRFLRRNGQLTPALADRPLGGSAESGDFHFALGVSMSTSIAMAKSKALWLLVDDLIDARDDL